MKLDKKNKTLNGRGNLSGVPEEPVIFTPSRCEDSESTSFA